MKRKAKKSAVNKEEICEDWCFSCKDGGTLRVCDYKDCLKAYHPECVGKDDSFLEAGSSWKCTWHSCDVCKRASNLQCYVCPTAVCKRLHCIKTAEFVHVRGKKGFCNYCFKLALLVEEKKDVDSDGETVDFKDRETYEGLFREYWEIINETEGLTAEILLSANARRKMDKVDDSDSSGSDNGGTNEVSDYDDSDNVGEAHKLLLKRKRSKGPLSSGKGKEKGKTSKTKFIGWASKYLAQFLHSIGKDTNKELSQREVTNIVNGYIKENKLLDSLRKKTIVCDERLQSLFGRKTVNKHRVYDLLEAHFADNQEQSEEEEVHYDLEDKDEDVLVACKRQRKSITDGATQKKKVVLNIPRFHFASVVPENIKLVYLKRSLVQMLSQQPETFENKVIGSFVRVKSDPNDCFRKHFFQLVQVKGVKKQPVGEQNQEIFLQVSDMPKDISICTLSDDDFSEEECQDLKNKVKTGLLKKLTLDELEQKARSLHEDIIKHWIPREISLLQNRIDRANEKGWRKELYEYLERKQVLQNPKEQSRLLQQVPKVIPDVEDLGTAYEDTQDDKKGDDGSPKSILMVTSENPGANLKGERLTSGVAIINEKSSFCSKVIYSIEDGDGQALNLDTSAVPAKEKKEPDCDESSAEVTPFVSETAPQEEKTLANCQLFAPKVKQTCLEVSVPEELPQDCGIFDCKSNQNPSPITSARKEATDVESETVKSPELINSSSDDDISNAAVETQAEDPESVTWHCLGPNGERNGPLSLKLLKAWSEGTPIAAKFKVWKTGQSEIAAIPLMVALKLAFQ